MEWVAIVILAVVAWVAVSLVLGVAVGRCIAAGSREMHPEQSPP